MIPVSRTTWLVAIAVAFAVPMAAQATTFTVNATGDQADAAAGNGACLTAAGTCTLRAAIQETNALAAGAPHTIAFAIPTTDAGFTVGTGVFTIVPAAVLPTITRAGTIVDGTTQAASPAGDTNPGALGVGGTVGVDGIALPQVQRPEILIRDNAALTTGLAASVGNVQILGLGIHGFGTAATNGDIVLTGATTGVRIVGNVIGSLPTSVALPGVAAQQSAGNGVTINAPDSGFVQNNLVAFQAFHGIVARGAATGWTISGNETRANGRTNNAAGGIAIEAAGTINNVIRGNLVVASGGAGIDTAASVGPNTTINNTVTGNGVFNNATAETPGIRVQGAANTIERNVVTANYGAGVMVVNAAQTNRITRNSIFANGTITNLGGTAATNQIGIDLLVAANSQTRGTAPFVSVNDSGDIDTGGNAITNFPVLVTAQRAGGNLVVSGFARPGAVIELFLAASDASGFGEGQTYLTTVVEGSGADTDATSGTYGPGAINGVVQGTDTTERFTVTLPLASLPAAVPAGAALTATSTLLNATSEFSGNVTVVELAADVRVALTDAPDPVAIGQPITYSVTVTNDGPGTATAISTSHALPLGATFTGATPSQGTCSQLLGNVTCSLGTLASTASATILVTVVPNSLGVAASNITVAAAETDPVPANNAAATTTTVVANADLTVTVADAPDPVAAGQQVTYTVTISNAGPDPALDVAVSNVLGGPANLVSITPSQGSCTSPGSCSLGAIGSGGSALITVVATATGLGTITNTATATTASTDPTVPNTGAQSTTVVANADVAIGVTDAPDPAALGQDVTFTVVVTNTGPDPAFGVTVTDLPTTGLSVVSATPSQGTCDLTVSCALGTIPSGASAVIGIAATATSLGTIGNTVTVATTSTDAVAANDTATTTTTVTAPVDLVVTATASPTSVTVGQPVTATLTVRNTGPGPATGVTLTHVVPLGTTLGTVTPSAGTCTQAGQVVTCVIGALAASATATVTLTLTPSTPGTLGIGASAAGNEAAPTVPNVAAATVAVTAAPVAPPTTDLDLDVHTSRTGPSPAGEFTALTAIVTNRGTAAATGVVVTLRVGNARPVATAESNGACTFSGSGTTRTATCTLGRIEPGGIGTAAIVVQAPRRGRISTVGSVAADQPDPTPHDTTDIAATLRPPLGRLTIRIDAPRRVGAGTVVPYTITVRNPAAIPAQDVIVAVAPPFGGPSAPVAIRTLAGRTHGLSVGRTVSIALGDLAPGETRVVSLTTVARRPLGVHRLAAAAIAVDGVAGTHTQGQIRVAAGIVAPPVTG